MGNLVLGNLVPINMLELAKEKYLSRPRKQRGGPSCLVLSPTRELAQQIEEEVKKFHYRGIRSVCIYGGGDRNQQIQLVKKGVEIVIGITLLAMINFLSFLQ